ncbi:MAG: glycogen/starch synthase [Chromatiales bacterium]|nr:glycogen/starch synthase [Chromatiales bacterium]
MKVAFLASEVIPYAKTGGLADVAGALPKFLVRLGADVRVFMPLYREVRQEEPAARARAGRPARADMGGGPVDLLCLRPPGRRGDGPVHRPAGLLRPRPALRDAGRRLSRQRRALRLLLPGIALETMKALDFRPDVVHGHDWQAAAAFAYLKFAYAADPFFAGTRSLFTIHNLAYQGLFDREVLGRVGLPDSLFNMD